MTDMTSKQKLYSCLIAMIIMVTAFLLIPFNILTYIAFFGAGVSMCYLSDLITMKIT